MTDGMQVWESTLSGLPMGLACIHSRWRWRKSDNLYECVFCGFTTQSPGRIPHPRRQDIEDEGQYREALRAYNLWHHQADIDKQESTKAGYAEREPPTIRPKRMAKLQAKTPKKMRLLDPEEFKEQRAEYNALRRLRRPHTRELILSILIVQYFAKHVWSAEALEQRTTVRAEAKITRKDVIVATTKFQNDGGIIEKLPEREVERVFYVHVKDG